MVKKTVLLDGAIGTSLWEKTQDKQPVWRYNIENPAVVSELHHEYISVGSEIILSNTFGANGGAVSHSPYQVRDVVSEGVRLAKDAVRGTNVKVALSVGPLTGLLEPYGDITYEEAYALYDEMISAGMSQHPDIIALQTFMDVEMLKIAQKAASKYDVPVFCSMSFQKGGRTNMGNSVSDMIQGLSEYPVAAVGLNCSLGPDAALPVLQQFTEVTDLPLIFKPNAGLPQYTGSDSFISAFDIQSFANDALKAIEIGATYVGGCCGSNPKYIEYLHARLTETQK